jgi:DNA-binding CsgD family transcriptional regulator
MVASPKPSRDHLARIARDRGCPGIFMFTLSKKLIWADRRAWDFCRRLTKERKVANNIPETIKDVHAKLLPLLKDNKGAKNRDDLIVRQVVEGSGISLLICGFGLPDPESSAQSRILILLEQIGRRGEAAAQQAQEIFRLTRREVEVVQHLLKGWSNKAIAHELQVSEQTVKEHLQRIMTKTTSTSRTGVLARVLFL